MKDQGECSPVAMRMNAPVFARSRSWPERHLSIHRRRGFSLIELVVVIIILGVLAAIAVPRFIDMGRSARVAALQTLAGAMQSTADNYHAMCKLDFNCDYANQSQFLTIGGRVVRMNYGWIDSGDDLNLDQIDAFVDHAGFTASLPNPDTTLFTLDGAPNPANCSVTYFDANALGPTGPGITTTTSGC